MIRYVRLCRGPEEGGAAGQVRRRPVSIRAFPFLFFMPGSDGLRRAELLNSITQGIELKKAPEPEPEDAGTESSEGEPTPRRRGCAAAT